MENERMLILQMVAEKKISVAEGIELLKAIEATAGSVNEAGGNYAGQAAQSRQEPARELPQANPPQTDGPRVQIGYGSRAASTGASTGPSGLIPARAPEPDMSWTGDIASKVGNLVTSVIANFGFGFGDGYKFEENIEGEFGDSETALLELQSRNGRISIQAWDRPGYAVKLVKHVRGVSEQEAKARADRMAEVIKEPSRLCVRMAHPDITNIGMAIIVYLPRNKRYTASLLTSNGRIEVLGLACQTLIGRTANGAVKIEDVDAEKIQLNSSNGKILLRTNASEVTAQSSNGRIVLVPMKPAAEARYSLTTSNGSVRLKNNSSDEVGFSLDLSTSNGKVELPEGVDLDYQVNEKSHTHRVVKATSRGFSEKPRKVWVSAHTSNGKIAIDNEIEWE